MGSIGGPGVSPSSRLPGVLLGIWTRPFTSNHTQTERATRTCLFYLFIKLPKTRLPRPGGALRFTYPLIYRAVDTKRTKRTKEIAPARTSDFAQCTSREKSKHERSTGGSSFCQRHCGSPRSILLAGHVQNLFILATGASATCGEHVQPMCNIVAEEMLNITAPPSVDEASC